MAGSSHWLNPEMIRIAQRAVSGLRKQAFVPGNDPSMMGGGAPPMDPSMMGGAPPMDPSMMGGAPPMDPSMMGGAPPMDPSMMAMMGGGAPPMDPSMMGGAPPGGGGGGGGKTWDDLIPAITKAVQQAVSQSNQSTPTSTGMLKPKIDINVEIMRLNKMVARIADALGIQIPAQDMVVTSTDLTRMAQNQSAQFGQDMDPTGGIGTIEPMKGFGEKSSSFWEDGQAFATEQLSSVANKAAAIAALRGRRGR